LKITVFLFHNNRRRIFPGRSPLAALALLFMAIATAATAQESPGRFEVRSARTKLIDGVYVLEARVEYRLSADARRALDAGVPLTLELETTVIRHRRFWPDLEIATLRQDFQLEFHALSQRYIVRNLNSGEQITFATLFSALNFLGRIDGLPIIDAALLEPGYRYDGRIRALLDKDDFPGPLQLLAFWRKEWSLESEWFRWRIAEK
jgi:hypothetical protein